MSGGLRRAALAGLMVLMAAAPALVQAQAADVQRAEAQPGGAPAQAAPEAAAPSRPAKARSAGAMGPAAVLRLVRKTLALVNRANATGDYRPVHAHLTPAVRKQVGPDAVAAALAAFRDNKIDISPVARLEPEFVTPPVVAADGRLLAMGVFQTRPRLVRFKLTYRKVGQTWLLEDFAVDTPTEREWAAAQAAAPKAGATAAAPASAQASAPTPAQSPASVVPGDPPATTRW